MVFLSNLNQLDFIAEVRVIHEDFEHGHPDKPKKLYFRTPKVLQLKLESCNFIATVVIIIISTIYYNVLVRGGQENGLIADKEGWNYHIEREFAVSKSETTTSTVKIVLLDAILISENTQQ